MMGKVLHALASLDHCKTQFFFSMPIFLSLKCQYQLYKEKC